jgi:hypothetical protein
MAKTRKVKFLAPKKTTSDEKLASRLRFKKRLQDQIKNPPPKSTGRSVEGETSIRKSMLKRNDRGIIKNVEKGLTDKEKADRKKKISRKIKKKK